MVNNVCLTSDLLQNGLLQEIVWLQFHIKIKIPFLIESENNYWPSVRSCSHPPEVLVINQKMIPLECSLMSLAATKYFICSSGCDTVLQADLVLIRCICYGPLKLSLMVQFNLI